MTPLIVFEVVVGATLTIAGLSLPLVVAHKAVITRRQLKVMAKWLKRSEEELQSRSFPQERWAEQEREGYAFMVAFRSKARFLRWFYWISILTIPFSGWGLLMLGLWALQYSSFATAVRATTGKKPKVLAQELCVEIDNAVRMEVSTRS